MHPREVHYGGVQYRYILTVMDVFSRFLWAMPLTSKASKEIAWHLKSIYDVHGPPKVLQHDQGKEFDGAVIQLMRKLNVKIIRSSPYHPQSQGKVERSHRSIRRKFAYDLLHKKSTNWVKSLANYCRVLNLQCREELGYRSSFTVYYGRTSNLLKNTLDNENPKVRRHEMATEHDLRRTAGAQHHFKANARAAMNRCASRMISRGIRHNPPSIYAVGDEVLVRVQHPKKKPTMEFVKVGKVTGRNLYCGRYKVKYRQQEDIRENWFSVKNLTSTTRSQEKKRKKFIKTFPTSRLNSKRKRSQYYITLKRGEWIYTWFGFSIRLDPIPNGNCQFEAVADQLQTIGIYRSAATLRQDVVHDLQRNPHLPDGTPLHHFVGQNNLNAYLTSMEDSGTFGDHITLARLSQLFNVQFIVFSSLGQQATRFISPSGTFEDLPVLFLAHEAEGSGEHYYSISGDQESEMNVISLFSSLGHTDERDEVCQEGMSNDRHEGQVVANNEQQADESNDAEIEDNEDRMSSQLPFLPPELIMMIVGMAIHADIHNLRKCSLVSWLFKESCDSHFRSCESCDRLRLLMNSLKPFHVRPTLVDDLGLGNRCTMSVRQFMKAVGRSSGLGIAVKSMLQSHPKWWSAWVTITPTDGWGPNWYRIVSVFWK